MNCIVLEPAARRLVETLAAALIDLLDACDAPTEIGSRRKTTAALARKSHTSRLTTPSPHGIPVRARAVKFRVSYERETDQPGNGGRGTMRNAPILKHALEASSHRMARAREVICALSESIELHATKPSEDLAWMWHGAAAFAALYLADARDAADQSASDDRP